MNHSMKTILLGFALCFASINIVQATDILATPSTLPFNEQAQAWDHPLATIVGTGELKFRDATANIPVDVSYKGTISCSVKVHAALDYLNRVEINAEYVGNEIEAKSKLGSIDLYSCTVTDGNGVSSAIPQVAHLNASKVKVDIEGFHTDVNGALAFSEYEAEGKVEGSLANKAKLELEHGTVTKTPTGGGGSCVPPFCGGGGGGVGGF